eukprot:COSAG04_NODE_12090_length_671_cov_0.786713_2_plen_25_part_01
MVAVAVAVGCRRKICLLWKLAEEQA